MCVGGGGGGGFMSAMPHGESDHNHWSAMKKCIVSATEAVVGCGRKKQPDWFLDAADTLLLLLDAKKVHKIEQCT